MNYIVETKHLKKYYQMGDTTVKALDGIDFCVKDQEFIAIIGKSGSGKSTLLHMLGGLDTPTEGEVLIEGKSILKLKNGKPRARRAKWLPDREVDLVYLYSDRYLDARNPSPAETDFFTVTRMDAWGVSTWFMCTPQAAEKLIAMDYDNLAIQETTIVG